MIFIIISFLECIPIKSPIVYNELPKEGDNFKSPSSDDVFYFTNNAKYSYTSADCYFQLGNPPFSATYKQGGIKSISTEIADQIVLKGSMCGELVVKKTESRKLSFIEKYTSVNYLLENFSTFSHFFFYMLLAFSIITYQTSNKSRYLITFIACFIGGGLLELVQFAFIEGRNASFEDIVMNSLGSCCAILIYHLYKMNSKSRLI